MRLFLSGLPTGRQCRMQTDHVDCLGYVQPVGRADMQGDVLPDSMSYFRKLLTPILQANKSRRKTA
jgi:hypothetical protein